MQQENNKLNIHELANRFMSAVVTDIHGCECTIIEISEEEAREYLGEAYDEHYFISQDDYGKVIFPAYLAIIPGFGVKCINRKERNKMMPADIATEFDGICTELDGICAELMALRTITEQRWATK